MVRLREIRKTRSYSQSDLARKAGVSQSMLSDIENGRVSPTVKVIERIAKALDVPVSELLDEHQSIA